MTKLSLDDAPQTPLLPLIHRPLTAAEVDAFAAMVRQRCSAAKSVSVDAMPSNQHDAGRTRYYVSVQFDPGTSFYIVFMLGQGLGCPMGNIVVYLGSWVGIRYSSVEPSAIRRFPRDEDE